MTSWNDVRIQDEDDEKTRRDDWMARRDELFKRESLSNDDVDVNENGKKAIGLGRVYMELGDPR